jgi:hypothetical protein
LPCNGVDGVELPLQLQRLALPSSPDDGQRDAGRVDEQEEEKIGGLR